MVVEHVFVTTHDSSTTLSMASALLREFGFTAAGQGIPLSPNMPAVLEMTRGRTRQSFQFQPSGLNLPQKISLTWDRGRVTVIASLTNLQVDSSINQRAGKPVQLQQKLLLAIASALEELLARGVSLEQAAQRIGAAQNNLQAHSRRVRYGCLAIAGVVVLIIGGMIVAGILLE